MSLRSPKHKFSAEVHFDRPLGGIGSVIIVTANTISEIENLSKLSAQGVPSHVTIKENKKEYPEFDWVLVSEYNLNK